jgi:hypothetical protein
VTPSATDKNGDCFKTKFEPTFWLKLVGIFLANMIIAGGLLITYMHSEIQHAIASHQQEAAKDMKAAVDTWWLRESDKMRTEWRIEIRQAILEHVSVGPPGDVVKTINGMNERLRSVESKIDRMDVKVNRLVEGNP